MSFQCLVLWWWSLSQEHSLLIFTQPKVFNFSRTPLIRIIISGQRRCGENTGVALSGTQFQAMTCSSSSRCCIQSFPRHSFNVCTSDFRRGLCTFDKNLHAWDLSWQYTIEMQLRFRRSGVGKRHPSSQGWERMMYYARLTNHRGKGSHQCLFLNRLGI